MKTSFITLKYTILITIFLTFACSDVQAGADIEFTDISLDDFSYPPGDLVRIDYVIRNVGDERSYNFYANAYASQDTLITEDDYYIGHDYVNQMNPGEGQNLTLNGRFPGNIPPGDYYVGMIALCPSDENPDNDTYYNSSTVLIDNSIRPDLEVSNVHISGSIPSHYHPGGEIRIVVSVDNIGVQKSGEYDIICYVSEDSTITEGDYRLGGRRGASSLDPGQGIGPTFNLYLPDNISAGNYYIGAIASCPMETNLDNSTDYGDMITIHAYPPDVVVQSIFFQDILYKPRDGIYIDLIVKNTGIGRANSYDIDFYASTDDYIEPTDYYLGSAFEGSLEPDEESSVSTSVDFPEDIPNGDYYIGVIIKWSYDNGSGSTMYCNSDSVWVGVPADIEVQSIGITPGEYLPDEEFVIYSLIENVGDWTAEIYTVDYYASTDAVITEDDHHIGYVERGDLSPGEQHSYDTIYQIPFNIAAGNYYIGAIVTCPREYDLANNTGCSEETIELVHPAGYVCGQMQYQTRWGRRELPIRYALVEVYDADDNEDPLDDRVIGKTHTDQNGNYGIIVLNDQMSSQNIYVKVFTESPIGAYPETTNKAGIVRDDVFDETYYMKSDIYPHPRDLSVVVNITAHEDSGEFMVYDSMIESFHKAKTFLDINMPEITTFWPCEFEASYFDPCDISIHISHEDRGDRDVIMHEYGHFVADVFAFAQGDIGDNSIHFWDLDLRYNPEDRNNEEARNLTFRESWATLFSVATQYGDKWHPYGGDTLYYDFDEDSGYSLIIDLEKDTDKKREPGEFYEHMNCCALWDIFDDNDDRVDDNDTLSDTNLSKIWSVLKASQPDDIIGFWNGWFARYEYTSQITRIFRDHEMQFKKPED